MRRRSKQGCVGEQKNQASGGWIQTVSNGQIKLQDGMECLCEIFFSLHD